MKKASIPLTWEAAPDVLTVEEAASLARIPRNAAYEAVRLGIVPSFNFGARRIRIAKSALEQVFGLSREHLPGTVAFSRDSGGK